MSHKNKYAPRIPLPVRGGIRAQARRGGFARQWWGRRWLALLESLQIGARLGRGRSYAFSGQVSALTMAAGRVIARVQGSNNEAYGCEIGLTVPPEERRQRLLAALHARPLLVARLLVRDLPVEIETIFRDAGLSLFPAGRDDLTMRCSCPDWANPCKHLVAVHLLLIEALDHDPLLLLSLRGIGRADLLGTTLEETAPAAQPVATEASPADAPEECAAVPADFWGASAPSSPPDFGPSPPAGGVPAPLARRLGPLPFWRGEERFLDSVGQASARAVAAGWRVWAGERVPSPRAAPVNTPAPLPRHGRPRMEV
ncbi:MAG: SWIM zinc finger family protein [Kiritimatiellae bacterium]|nr:SWIM zinc finger family protein [Kiritimatiellia bacterium]